MESLYLLKCAYLLLDNDVLYVTDSRGDPFGHLYSLVFWEAPSCLQTPIPSGRTSSTSSLLRNRLLWFDLELPLAGGFTDMLFCIFCMMSVKGSGLSNSCPLQIGLATVFGSILTSMQRVCITIRYCIEKKGNLYYLIPGLLMNITGIALNSITYSYEKPFAFIVVASRKIRRVL